MPDGTGAPFPTEPPLPARDPRLVTLAAALHATATVRRLAADLSVHGVPVMVLRGPPVQLRLLDDEAAYRSADVDLLIPAHHRRRVFGLLRMTGWTFSADNGVLWRLDRAAAFARGGVTVDLHWGLHAHTVSAGFLRPLERALWSDATRGSEGWYRPEIEPLLVYLAVHGHAAAFHKPESLTLIAAASRLVTDWAEVERLARRAHVWSSVRHSVALARGETVGPAPPLFDGRARRAVSRLGRQTRSELGRPAFRAAVRAVRSRRSKS